MSQNQNSDIFEQHLSTCDRRTIFNSLLIGLFFIPLIIVQTKVIINEVPIIKPAFLVGSVYLLATILMFLVYEFLLENN
jgi:hypothetical protein